MAGYHLRERRRAGAARFPVIRQLPARGRIAGAISEQRLAVGGGNVSALVSWLGGRTGGLSRWERGHGMNSGQTEQERTARTLAVLARAPRSGRMDKPPVRASPRWCGR
jgi:hypothetical protein